MNSFPEAPAVSAAASAAGRMLVPGCVSMRKVSHFPPASIISELAKAAPLLVTLAPFTMMVVPLSDPCFLFGDEADGLPAAGRLGAEQCGRHAVKRQSLGAVDHGRRQVFEAQRGDPPRELPAE